MIFLDVRPPQSAEDRRETAVAHLALARSLNCRSRHFGLYYKRRSAYEVPIRTDIRVNTKESLKSTKELTEEKVFKIQKTGKLFDRAASLLL